MIALDTNILVYAKRPEPEHHPAAVRLLKELAEGDDPWALPWPCVYEFLRVVTHPRLFHEPTSVADALDCLESLFDSPSLTLLGEGPTHPALMHSMVGSGHAVGNLAHDAHIAALAIEHGVRELWTLDRDFARFPGLRIKNPFEPPAVHERRTPYRAKRRPVRASK